MLVCCLGLQQDFTMLNSLTSSVNCAPARRIHAPVLSSCRQNELQSKRERKIGTALSVQDKHANRDSEAVNLPSNPQWQRSQLLRSSVALSGAAVLGSLFLPDTASAGYDRPLEDYDRAKLLEQNKRMQRLNQVPDGFPGFVRQGNPKVVRCFTE